MASKESITESKISDILRLYAEHKSMTGIAEALNIYVKKVSKIVNQRSCRYRKNRIITKICEDEHCENSFTTNRLDNKKFCSKACASRNIKRNGLCNFNSCRNCELSLKGHHVQKKYCSKKCEMEYREKMFFQEIESDCSLISDRRMKIYLIKKYGEKCMECGWDEKHPITGKVPIELEHVDGDSKNQQLSNLQLLCPNHHSLTKTYRALNRGRGRTNRITNSKKAA